MSSIVERGLSISKYCAMENARGKPADTREERQTASAGVRSDKFKTKLVG